LGGGEGEVVFGDVEELGGVFRAALVGHCGADALVAWDVVRIGEKINMLGSNENLAEMIHHLPVQLALLHPLLFLLFHGQFEELFCHAADVVRSFQDRLAVFRATEFQIEETSCLACFEDAVLLFGVFREEFGQGNRFQID